MRPDVGWMSAEQHADGGGLARAVRAEEAEQVALAHVEVDVVDGQQTAGEPLGELLGADDAAHDQPTTSVDDDAGDAVELGHRDGAGDAPRRRHPNVTISTLSSDVSTTMASPPHGRSVAGSAYTPRPLRPSEPCGATMASPPTSPIRTWPGRRCPGRGAAGPPAGRADGSSRGLAERLDDVDGGRLTHGLVDLGGIELRRRRGRVGEAGCRRTSVSKTGAVPPVSIWTRSTITRVGVGPQVDGVDRGGGRRRRDAQPGGDVAGDPSGADRGRPRRSASREQPSAELGGRQVHQPRDAQRFGRSCEGRTRCDGCPNPTATAAVGSRYVPRSAPISSSSARHESGAAYQTRTRLVVLNGAISSS